jgi:hypothetical protein
MRQTQDLRHCKHTNVPLQKNVYRNLRNISWSPYTRNRAVHKCCILPRSFPYSRKGSSKGLRFPRILSTALVSDFPKRRISLARRGFPRILATALFKGTSVLNFQQDSFLRILASLLLWILTSYVFYLHITATFLTFFFGVVLLKTKFGFTLVLSLLVSETNSVTDRRTQWIIYTDSAHT